MGWEHLQIRLSPQHTELVRRKVESGRYSDTSEVLAEALRLLDERDRLEALRAAIANGKAEIDRGEYVEWTPESMDQLIRKADEADRLGLPIDDDVIP